ncbi:MAG: FGGY family carbohydrate kinase [bacterium]|nr:FGGY family carbohydrate kinase [bacterium]
MRNLFAGIDCSTQSCKLVVIDIDDQELLFSDLVNYDNDLPQYQTQNGVMSNAAFGVSESNPLMWIDALNILFQRLKKSSVPQHEIKSISVSGQMHGLVCLDEAGNLSRPHSKLWNDFSTQTECELLTEAVGGLEAMIAEVGNSQRTGYTASKIFHLVRHEPEIYAKTATLFLVHNYINWYLTGGKNGGVRVMEPGDVSGMALWHPGKRKWSDRVVQAIAPDLASKLPPLKPSDQSIGLLSAELVKKYGFSAECKIDAGCGDNMYGAVGTGNVVPGIVTISLGTSGTAYTFLEKAFIDPKGDIGAFCDSTGNHLPLLCVSNLANGYNALLEQFNFTHDQFSEIIKQTDPGADGKLMLPWFGGERTPDVPLATTVYLGFQLDEFNPANLCRAVLDGHILNLFDGFERMPVQPREIRLTGGLSRSEAWRQTIADVFETEVVPVQGEGAALGAALHAAWVYLEECGSKVSLEHLAQPFVNLQESARKKPLPSHVARYSIVKKIFQSLSLAVRGCKPDADIFALRNELISTLN